MTEHPEPKITRCFLCKMRIEERFRLYTRTGDRFGDYCSRECAAADAYGPKLTPHKIRKIPEKK